MQRTNYSDNHITKRPRLDFGYKPPSTTKKPRLDFGDKPPATMKPRLDCEENANKPIRRLDEFEMLNKIGEGTYGVVYRARDKKTTEIVAVKKLKTSMLADRKKLGFRLPETEILTTLTHPSIIDLKQVVAGSHVGSLFMVMGYVENDLKSLLSAKKQPFTLSQNKCLMQQLLQGVACLHRNQLVDLLIHG